MPLTGIHGERQKLKNAAHAAQAANASPGEKSVLSVSPYASGKNIESVQEDDCLDDKKHLERVASKSAIRQDPEMGLKSGRDWTSATISTTSPFPDSLDF